jgi:hypothetical protein
MLSMPADWNIREKELQSHSTDKRIAIHTAMTELIERGYVYKTGERMGRRYYIDEIAHTQQDWEAYIAKAEGKNSEEPEAPNLEIQQCPESALSNSGNDQCRNSTLGNVENMQIQSKQQSKQIKEFSDFENRESKNEKPPDEQKLSTAIAVAIDPPSKKSVTGPPSIAMTAEQLALFHAARACFENSPKTKALIYADKQTAAREMKALKTLILRCWNLGGPDITPDFIKNLLEHFRFMVNGNLKGKAAFTPSSLLIYWIWQLTIDTMPETAEDKMPIDADTLRKLFKRSR